MSSYYYYLISSLPVLNSSSNMSYDNFLELCSSADSKLYNSLKNITLENAAAFKGCPLVREFGEYYLSVKCELSRRRKINKAGTGSSGIAASCTDCRVSDIVSRAMNSSDPLQAELILIDSYLRYIDGIVSMHFFDEYVLFAYALKVKILERRSVFSEERGKSEFDRLFNKLQCQINVL